MPIHFFVLTARCVHLIAFLLDPQSQEIAAALIALAAVRRRSQPLMPEADTISTTSSHSALELASTTGDRRSRADSMGNILDSAAAPPKIRVKPADSSRSSLSVDHAAATDHAQVSASNTARQTGAAPGSGLDSAAAAARHLPPPFPDNVDESRKNSIRLSLAIALEEPPEVEEPVVSTPIPEETVSMTATSESIPRLGMAHASSLDMTPSERQSSVGLIDALGAPAAGTRSQSASPPPASRRAPRLSRSDVEEAYTMLQREIPELTPLDEFATSLGRPMTRDDLALLVLAVSWRRGALVDFLILTACNSPLYSPPRDPLFVFYHVGGGIGRCCGEWRAVGLG